jgi:class 3 adenylate cyclase/tetratricopeptide (TPR) repeat protein
VTPRRAPPRDAAAEILKPYVPRIAIDWLREAPAQRHRKLEGSLAFVDVSGFTQLTERLSRKGKVGAEEVNQALDSCFTEFLSVAYGYGAGVIKWGGDAVLLLFTGDGHEARACRAAFEMQRTMRTAGRIRTSSGNVVLRMSVGIHSGPLDFFFVGDLHRELVITGPGASATVEMEAVAEAGEVAISPVTASALDPRCIGAAKGPAFLLRRGPEVSTLDAKAVEDVSGLDLAQCIAVDVREHLLGGGGEPEHRPMAAAFIHFMGADELLEADGSEALADALEHCLGSVQRIARRHGVAFFDTDVYQSGGKIMLMAGAPRSAGDDEGRMLHALREIVDAGGPLALRAGVNSGRIFVGDFGPPYRRTYTVTGDAVNLAARLMSRAEPGQIVATDDVLQRSRSAFEATPLEPFQAKGKAEPVHAFAVGRPTGARVGRDVTAPLVGRERELASLLDALASARDRAGRVVEVVAEPGMGKSRLLQELVAQAGDVRTHSVQCDEYEATTPYFAFRGFVRGLLGLADELDAGEERRRLRAGVQKAAPELLPWLPLVAAVAGVGVPETAEAQAIDERFRKERIERATVELLVALLQEPTLLIFEDAHWMDDASADLLRLLASKVLERPWLVVATRRDQATGFTAPDEAAPTVLALEPLAAEHAAALVNAATDDAPLPPHEIAALAARAGGNPLFLGELLAAARRSGSVDELPDSVEKLLLAQIDRLSPADRGVLRCAAVIGASFSPDLLAAALDEKRLDPDVWSRLGDLVVLGDGQLRFRHALVRDAAYEGLPYRRRRELHARVGETIERAAGTRPEQQAELLSLHFFNANRFEQAWRYSRLAGERARDIYANVEAASFFERALESAKRSGAHRDGEIATVSEALGDVRVRLGEFVEAGRAFRASRRGREADPVEEARMLLKEALIPWRLGRYPQAMRWINRGLRTLEGVPGTAASAERARLHAWCGVVRQKQGRPREAIEWCERAIEEAERCGARDALAHAYYILDWSYVALGRTEEAVHSPRALEIYEELGNLERQAIVLNNMGVWAYFRAEWDEAVSLYERARDAWERCGDSWAASFATTNIGEILSDQGRLDEAEQLFLEALRIARASGAASGVADVSCFLGRLHARAGRFEEAHSLLSAARRDYEESGEPSELLTCDAHIAECLSLQGDGREALALAEATLRRAERLEARFALVPTLQRIRGWALAQLGRTAEAFSVLESSLDEARADGSDYEVALVLDGMIVVGELIGRDVDALGDERRSIVDRLGIVSIPRLPLPGAT